MEYFYTVRKSSWPYSSESFNKLRQWARTQPGYWWNAYSSPLGAFSFRATPEVVEEVFDELEISEYGLKSGVLDIDTDSHARPKTEL